MLKTFNCLGLDILALGYSSHFFLIDFVDCRHFTEMRPIKKINLVTKVKFSRLIIQAILITSQI